MENTYNSTMLGETDIKKYVKVLANQTNKNSLIKTLNKLEERNLESEKYFIKELKNKILPMEYSLIDLSFLEKSSKLKTKLKNKVNDNPITVPSFGVYQFYGDNEFSILFICENERLTLYFSEIPRTIHEHFLKLYTNEEGFTYIRKDNFKVKRKTMKDYKLLKDGWASDRPSIKITKKFNGIIPEKTLKRVERSLKYFKKEKIYTITEIKPDQWNVSVVEIDPLIIGMYNHKVYLIDHFDTTELEDLVKDNFTRIN